MGVGVPDSKIFINYIIIKISLFVSNDLFLIFIYDMNTKQKFSIIRFTSIIFINFLTYIP